LLGLNILLFIRILLEDPTILERTRKPTGCHRIVLDS